MSVRFTKMQGAGNDYLFLDGFAAPLPADLGSIAVRMSDRHFGVGADGVITVEPSASADFAMRVFNADGSEAEMCGNGLRCAYRYLVDRERIPEGPSIAHTRAGRIAVDRDRETGCVTTDLLPPTIGATVTLDVDGRATVVHEVDVGNPHAVVFLDAGDDLDAHPVATVGAAIAGDARYPHGTNVEFATVRDAHSVAQRTFERGAGETLACGTGACAVVAAGIASQRLTSPVDVHLRGGRLRVTWPGATAPIRVAGPAVEVFSGEWAEANA